MDNIGVRENPHLPMRKLSVTIAKTFLKCKTLINGLLQAELIQRVLAVNFKFLQYASIKKKSKAMDEASSIS